MENLVGKVVKILPCAKGTAKHHIGKSVIVESETEENMYFNVEGSIIALVNIPHNGFQKEFEVVDKLPETYVVEVNDLDEINEVFRFHGHKEQNSYKKHKFIQISGNGYCMYLPPYKQDAYLNLPFKHWQIIKNQQTMTTNKVIDKDNWFVKVNNGINNVCNYEHPVIVYLNKKFHSGRNYHDGSACYYGIVNGQPDFHNRSEQFEGQQEITFEEFKQHIMQQNKEEIIGYKSPQDYFNGNYKKGTVYVRDVNDFFFMYKPIDCVKGSKWSLPKEIVETWEPVYAAKEITLSLGTPKQEIVIGKTKIQCLNKEVSIYSLKAIAKVMGSNPQIQDWTVTFPTVKIGCTEFTTEEINQIINKYNELN